MKKTIQRRFNGKASPSQDELNERLAEAASEGNADEVDALLKQGADANAQDEYGWTPLHRTAWKGQAEVVCALIERGADVNAQGADGWTALHGAAQYGRMKTAIALIGYGADVNAKDAHGKTPLDQAQDFGKIETAQKLREVVSFHHARKVKAVRLGKRWRP